MIQETQKWVGIASTALLGDISEVSGNLNVAGNITGTAATFTGNVTIGAGTITYDDVTFCRFYRSCDSEKWT